MAKDRAVTPVNAEAQELRFARVLNWVTSCYGEDGRQWPAAVDRAYGNACDCWALALYWRAVADRSRISNGPLERGGRILTA